jgi:hypothetical protein
MRRMRRRVRATPRPAARRGGLALAAGLSLALLESYDIGDRAARYVRLVGYGNTWNRFTSITEMAVY